ncbi:uncharacterized protein LOC143464825 [Clavelina lepadiformis]|uniref:uncharacterized protein LOC143464825 n=1 Tax=Clavelina lepadiformis TaxID=159417 RepID=UPI0040422F85
MHVVIDLPRICVKIICLCILSVNAADVEQVVSKQNQSKGKEDSDIYEGLKVTNEDQIGEEKFPFKNAFLNNSKTFEGNIDVEDSTLSNEMHHSIVIGVAVTAFLLLLLLVSKSHQSLCVICKRIHQYNKTDHVEAELEEGDIRVSYDLWENRKKTVTISELVTMATPSSSQSVRPFDPRSVSSYRESFRKY